jgi:hypothetical protein
VRLLTPGCGRSIPTGVRPWLPTRGLVLLALDYETGPSRFCLDSLIEQRVSWWHRIAEIGPRGKPEDAATTLVLPDTASAPLVTPVPVATGVR